MVPRNREVNPLKAKLSLAWGTNRSMFKCIRGTILNKTKYCEQKYVNIEFFVCNVGPINYGPPKRNRSPKRAGKKNGRKFLPLVCTPVP